MPGYKRPFDKGTLFVKFEVIFPPSNWLPKSQLSSLEALLPPRQAVSTSGHVEEVVLSDVDHTRQKKQDDMMDEDEQQGGPQVWMKIYCRFNVPINKNRHNST